MFVTRMLTTLARMLPTIAWMSSMDMRVFFMAAAGLCEIDLLATYVSSG